jgi:hypothetical protein
MKVIVLIDERCDGAMSPAGYIYRQGTSYTKQRDYSQMHVSHLKHFCVEFRLLLLVGRSIDCFDGCVVGRLIRIWVFGWQLNIDFYKFHTSNLLK